MFDSLVETLEIFFNYSYESLLQLLFQILVQFLRFFTFIISFSWDISKEILSNLGITQLIDLAWEQLDSRILGIMKHLKIPQAIDIILSARIARFLLSHIPFSKF